MFLINLLSLLSLLASFGIFALGFYGLSLGDHNLTVWGVGLFLFMCGLFVPFQIVTQSRLERKRQAAIAAHRAEWGDALCSALLSKQVKLDMTKEQVALAWGRPRAVDEVEQLQEVQARRRSVTRGEVQAVEEIRQTVPGGVRERWLYGELRTSSYYLGRYAGTLTTRRLEQARHVWFTNGRVTKISLDGT